MTDARALAVLAQALDLPPDQRDTFIADAGRGDPALRTAVTGLLAAHDASAGFLETAATAPAPRELGPWRLLKPIGAGGMGQVWLGERADGRFEQQVAIKIFASTLGDPAAIRRAESERQFLARLNHANIAHVIDGGSTEYGQPYVVMEYVDGLRIDDWCRQQQLDLRARVGLFAQVLAAVGAAHRLLIIHRDLKPSNVLVTTEGTVKLLDFGIAKSLDTGTANDATGTRLAPLTPQYASPEQLAGQPLSTASDIYTLGLLLYELLTGAAARERQTINPGVLNRWLDRPTPTRPSTRVDASGLALTSTGLRDWQRRLDGDLDRIVLTALAAEPERRYASVEAFADDLVRWLEQRPVKARGDSRSYRIGKFLRRNRLPVAMTALAVTALLAGLAMALIQAQRANTAAERAQQANRFLLDMIARADPQQTGMQPTLLDALLAATPEIGQRLAGHPAMEADIRLAIGNALLALDRPDAAEEQLQAAHALRRHDGTRERMETLQGLANLAWSNGQFSDAEARFKEALALTPDDAAAIARRSSVLNDYGAMLSVLERYDEAQQLLEQGHALARDNALVDARDLAVLMGNIANAHQGLGNLDEADAIYRRAQQQLTARGDASRLDLATSYANHSTLLVALGRLDQAVAVQERALALRVQVLGEDHPRLVTLWANLAQMYARQGRHDEAAATIGKALALAPGLYGEGNPLLGHVHHAAARIALVAGNRSESAAQARRALAIYEANEEVDPARIELMRETLAGAGEANSP